MALWAFALILAFVDEPAKPAPQGRTEVVIEKQDGAKAVPMSPQHVYISGDLIRIRFRTNSDGFLYVVNRDTKNRLTVLFPTDEAGRENQVRAGIDYIIPATSDGWFRVEGIPGYDTTYFVVSPTDLRAPAKATEPEPAAKADSEPAAKAAGSDTVANAPSEPESTLRPRCDDTLFKARGECMDSNSGVRNLPPAEKLPSGIDSQGKPIARDLTFIRQPQSTVILSKPSTDKLVVYEVRIAHQ
ncbi:MAG: DUF4384 domain-containing protein [Bryobacteraceae bacterium]